MSSFARLLDELPWHTLLATLFVVSDWAIRLAMLAVVPNRRSPEAAKGWLLLTLVLPWLGLLLYLVIGRPRLPAWRLERRLTAESEVRARIAATVPDPLPSGAIVPAFRPSVRLATALGTRPVVGGNALELLADYTSTIDRIRADIDAARESAHLCFYILADDHATAPVFEALGRAAARGVQCRVLLDAFGSKPYAERVLARLGALGVAARVALPVTFGLRSARFDLRNHRKIVVIDGRVGYIGSQNLVAADFKPGLEYHELVVRLHGPAVMQLQAIFAADWFVDGGEALPASAFPRVEPEGDVPVQILASSPADGGERAERLVVDWLYTAERRAILVTPYFIPDQALLQALQTAARRGAEVRLVVDRQVDQFLVGHAQRSYYAELLDAGVHIHAFSGGFLHTKAVSVDGTAAWIGSCNMDMRSFALNEEVVALCYHPQTAAQLDALIERYLQASTPIEAAAWNARPFRQKFVDNLTRLVSPLL
jgi:cardiolipin synthase